MIDPVSVGEWVLSLGTGLLGLAGVFLYSFLVACVLPMPGEIVLALPIDIGLSRPMTLLLIIIISSLGKSFGSLLAVRVGGQVSRLDPVSSIRRWLPSFSHARSLSLLEIIDQDSRIVDFTRRYGYVGLSLVLAIPLMPDTAAIYAFSLAKIDPAKFALAAFAGTVFRLLTILSIAEITLDAI